MATFSRTERDRCSDVALSSGDTRHHVFVPDEFSLVEFAIVRNSYRIIEDYFFKPIPEQRIPQSFETILSGRVVRLYGISEEEAFQQFKNAFHIEDEDLIVPVVKNTELAIVIDQYIVSQLRSIFDHVRLPEKYVRPENLNREEKSELIEFEETAITVEKVEAQCLPLMEPQLNPIDLLAVLELNPPNIKSLFHELIQTIEKRANIFRTIVVSAKELDGATSYTSLDVIKFVLGEEMLKRIKSQIPIIWKLPRDQVERVHRFVECKVRDQTQSLRMRSSSEIEALADAIREPFTQFIFLKDYYLENDFLPVLLKLVHQELSPYPQLEIVREAFKTYVEIEKLVHYATTPLFRLLSWAKKKLPNVRKQIVERLEKTTKWQEVASVLEEYRFPEVQLSHQEKEIFVFFFITLLTIENEVLMGTFARFLEDEIEDVLDLIVDAVQRGEKEVNVFFDEATLRDQLLEIEAEAKLTLQKSCAGAEILMVYGPLWGGREVCVGRVPGEEKKLDRYYKDLRREVNGEHDQFEPFFGP